MDPRASRMPVKYSTPELHTCPHIDKLYRCTHTHTQCDTTEFFNVKYSIYKMIPITGLRGQKGQTVGARTAKLYEELPLILAVIPVTFGDRVTSGKSEAILKKSSLGRAPCHTTLRSSRSPCVPCAPFICGLCACVDIKGRGRRKVRPVGKA